MPITTRVIIAVVAGGLMVGGVVASIRDRDLLAVQLMTLAFAFATFWTVLSTYWALSNPSMAPPRTYLVLTTMAVTATIYYGYKAKHGVGFSESLLDR